MENGTLSVIPFGRARGGEPARKRSRSRSRSHGREWHETESTARRQRRSRSRSARTNTRHGRSRSHERSREGEQAWAGEQDWRRSRTPDNCNNDAMDRVDRRPLAHGREMEWRSDGRRPAADSWDRQHADGGGRRSPDMHRQDQWQQEPARQEWHGRDDGGRRSQDTHRQDQWRQEPERRERQGGREPGELDRNRRGYDGMAGAARPRSRSPDRRTGGSLGFRRNDPRGRSQSRSQSRHRGRDQSRGRRRSPSSRGRSPSRRRGGRRSSSPVGWAQQGFAPEIGGRGSQAGATTEPAARSEPDVLRAIERAVSNEVPIESSGGPPARTLSKSSTVGPALSLREVFGKAKASAESEVAEGPAGGDDDAAAERIVSSLLRDMVAPVRVSDLANAFAQKNPGMKARVMPKGTVTRWFASRRECFHLRGPDEDGQYEVSFARSTPLLQNPPGGLDARPKTLALVKAYAVRHQQDMPVVEISAVYEQEYGRPLDFSRHAGDLEVTPPSYCPAA